ncbi:MAG: sigma-70 family RNA polymerase sigma factor [Verrucomicrobiae bacterium]|nr:sigma-70 family RNA polymerase sigma factor [Verrucomicrobiae bacterium]
MEPSGQAAGECVTVDDLRDLIGELRMVAARLLAFESRNHTYTPTALAMTALRRAKLKEEAWEDVRWENRGHFMAAMSVAMRNALVDHARRRRAKGRSKVLYLPPDEDVFRDLPAAAEEKPERVLMLEEALTRLGEQDARLAGILRQHYYFGYTVAEMAQFQEVSEKTVDRDLKKARVLLRKMLEAASRMGEA